MKTFLSRRWVTTPSGSRSTDIQDGTSQRFDDNHKNNKQILLGGDFAGYCTQCDPVTGDALPVPVYLVPPSMLEWGQHPKTLELIVSEDSCSSSSLKSDQDDKGVQTWDRVCLSVLPETGCGVDNLEVQKTNEPDWRVVAQTESSIGLIRPIAPTNTCIETIFGLSLPNQKENHRLRVAVTLSDEFLSIKSIRLCLERRFDESTQGSRANGGGLDGASVSRWMGPWMAKQGVRTLETKNVDEINENETSIQLPANVTMHYRTSEESSVLSVSHSSGQNMEYEWSAGDLLDTIRVVL